MASHTSKSRHSNWSSTNLKRNIFNSIALRCIDLRVFCNQSIGDLVSGWRATSGWTHSRPIRPTNSAFGEVIYIICCWKVICQHFIATRVMSLQWKCMLTVSFAGNMLNCFGGCAAAFLPELRRGFALCNVYDHMIFTSPEGNYMTTILYCEIGIVNCVNVFTALLFLCR